MNTKLSGAQLVLVEIKRVGKNYLPLVENIRGRIIKFIDFAPAAYLPGTDVAGVTVNQDMYFTIANEPGNEYIHFEMPLERFDYTATLGIRQPICSKVSLQNSYISITKLLDII